VIAVLTAQEPSAKYLVNLQPPLVRHFDLIAQAPGGVALLRELILTLAVQGKLVPQDTSDEPAIELLKKIRAEKDRLLAEGKIKRDKPLAQIADEEKPFELPTGWAWERFGAIAGIERGGSPRPIESFLTDDPSGLNWIKIGDTEKGGKYITSASQKIKREGLVKTRMVYPGDFLLTNSMSFGRPYITQIEGCIHDGWLRISPPSSLDKDFLYALLSSRFIRTVFEAAAAGAVVLNLNADKVRTVPIPLPPLAEQSRIVARVEELMQLCDALEAQGQLEAEQHARLVSTLFGSLLQSDTPEALADNWQRIATHFDVLLDRPEAVDALEQTILQLAVRGLLVPQDPTDEPASVLLQKIRTEKDHLIAQGKIKRDKPLPPITDEEKPFELPRGWEWVSLGLLTSLVTSGSRSWKDFYSAEGATFIRSQDIKYDRLEFDERAYVKLPIGREGVRTQVRRHDVLITITGANVGKAAVVAQSMDEAYVSQHVALVRLCDARLVDFLHLWLVSGDEGRKRLLMSSYGAKPGLNLQNISDLLVPLPPLAEQIRIVTLVNEKRALCDHLRRCLNMIRFVQAKVGENLIAST
jgi:type I restriction enzyme S subunit